MATAGKCRPRRRKNRVRFCRRTGRLRFGTQSVSICVHLRFSSLSSSSSPGNLRNLRNLWMASLSYLRHLRHLRLHRVWLRPPGPHYVHPGPRTGISWPMKPAPESVPSSAATSSATEPGALGKRRRTPATISATVRLPFANLQIKAPVRLTAIAAAVSGLTKRVQPSGPCSQMANGLGNGRSWMGMVGWDALLGLLRLGDRAGLRFVEVAAFLTTAVLCRTADCRRAPRPTLHQSGAVSPAAMKRSSRNTPTADLPLQFDLSGPPGPVC